VTNEEKKRKKGIEKTIPGICVIVVDIIHDQSNRKCLAQTPR